MIYKEKVKTHGLLTSHKGCLSEHYHQMSLKFDLRSCGQVQGHW